MKYLCAMVTNTSHRYTLFHQCTANSIKVVLPKADTVNYERTRDDGLLLIFTSKLGIVSYKPHREHIGNLLRQIYLLQNSLSIRA